MSIPFARACSPLVDEMITGPFATVAACEAFARGSPTVLPNNRGVPARALPASVVTKNLRRVQESMNGLLCQGNVVTHFSSEARIRKQKMKFWFCGGPL